MDDDSTTTAPDEPEAAPPKEDTPRSRGGGPWERPWQIRKSLRDRKFKGVAGGVAAAANVDATLVRILFAVAMFSGWGIIAYIVLCFVLKDETVEHPATRLPHDQQLLLRIALGIAAVACASRLFGGWPFGGRDGGPGLGFLLIIVGAVILWTRRSRHLHEDPPADDMSWADPDPAGIYGTVPPPPSWGGATSAPLGAGVDWRSTGRDILRLLGAFVAVWALLALVGGTLLVGTGAVQMRLPFLPAALGTLGLIALVVAVVKRAGLAGMLISGIVLFLATALALGLTSLPGGTGEKRLIVASGQTIEPRYEHGVGALLLDLSQATLGPEDQRTRITLGTGQLTVTVPAGIATEVHAQIGAGNLTIFGTQQAGPRLDMRRSDGGGLANTGTLHLDIDMGVGQLIVNRAKPFTALTQCEVPTSLVIEEGYPVICTPDERFDGVPTDCAIVVDPARNDQLGRAFCRRQGLEPPPAPGRHTITCSFGPNSDRSHSCTAVPAGLKAPTPPPAAPATVAPPAPPTNLACGPPNDKGERSCTVVTTATTAATPSTVICTEDAATKQLVCQP